MTFKKLLERVKRVIKPSTDEEIQRRREQAKELALLKAARLKHLIKDQTGWAEFLGLIDEYIEASQLRKFKTRLDIADEKTLQILKELDHDIYLLKWVKNIPMQFITQAEIKEEEPGVEE